MDSTEPPAPAPDVEGSPSLRGAAKKRLAMMAAGRLERLSGGFFAPRNSPKTSCCATILGPQPRNSRASFDSWKEHLPLHR